MHKKVLQIINNKIKKLYVSFYFLVNERAPFIYLFFIFFLYIQVLVDFTKNILHKNNFLHKTLSTEAHRYVPPSVRRRGHSKQKKYCHVQKMNPWLNKLYDKGNPSSTSTPLAHPRVDQTRYVFRASPARLFFTEPRRVIEFTPRPPPDLKCVARQMVTLCDC